MIAYLFSQVDYYPLPESGLNAPFLYEREHSMCILLTVDSHGQSRSLITIIGIEFFSYVR